MASLYITTDPPSDIDYSMDGNIKEVMLYGETLFSNTVNVLGWEEKLSTFIKEQELDVDTGHGLNAFVVKIQEDGLLK